MTNTTLETLTSAQVVALLPCNTNILPAARVRGGKGFEARYQAHLAAQAKHNAVYCADASQQHSATLLDRVGLSGCNDCADGLVGTPHHMRGVRPLALIACV